jgi:hypothetical protein
MDTKEQFNKKYSVLVLDYKKPEETKLLLRSIRENFKFDYNLIYLHNGKGEDYGYQYFKDGLIDQFIQTKNNNGLGIGTRDLFAACFSEYAIYAQNDQYVGRVVEKDEIDFIASQIGVNGVNENKIVYTLNSVSLAGQPCGPNIYSERAHIVKTSFYKNLEFQLPIGGAGPYHSFEWREGYIQNYYKQNHYIHGIYQDPIFVDNGRSAVRENPDGSIWKHEPDMKRLYLLKGPVKEKYVYPRFTDQEWDEVIRTQIWPDGQIPSQEEKESFHVWN